jgi:signal transduction histidine kinase/CheY-like chemotaxis protein
MGMSAAHHISPPRIQPEPADRLLRRARVLELVYEVTRAINSSLNLDEVTEFIYQGISRILPTDNFYIAFPSADNREIEFAIEIENRQRRPWRSRPAGGGLTEYLLGSRRPLLIPRNFQRACKGLGITYAGVPALSWMGAPMVFRDRAVGVIAIQSYEGEDMFDTEHLSVLENLASQAASAVENARLFHELKSSYQDLQSAQQRLLQSEKLAAVGQLISGIAHELNNPLTGVVGWTQFLLGQDLPATVRPHLITVNDQAQRATRIVQNLLTFSRQHRPEKTSVSLNEVVENTLALRAYELKVNNVQVHRILDPGLGRIHADPHQLQQVILNLIINAEQAILQDPAGGGRNGTLVPGGNLRVETRVEERRSVTHPEANDETSAGQPGVLLTVADDGPGIAPDLLKKIFDPFFTTKPIGQGTGLGLSISYGIIQEHGGRIWAGSVPGLGASFHVFLPCETVTVEELESEELTRPAQVEASYRVLVVDDEESVRELLTVVLESENMAVHTAATGEEGLERASQSRYDLIVTDLKMPGLSGGMFYDRLSASLLDQTPRFLFMTGDVLGAETQKLLSRTGSACILKPFDIYRARDVIQQNLEEISRSSWQAQSAPA